MAEYVVDARVFGHAVQIRIITDSDTGQVLSIDEVHVDEHTGP